MIKAKRRCLMGLLIRLQVVMLGIYLSCAIETGKRIASESAFFSEKFETKKKRSQRQTTTRTKMLCRSIIYLWRVVKNRSLAFQHFRQLLQGEQQIFSRKGATEPIPWLVLAYAFSSWHKYSRTKIFVGKHGALWKVPFRLPAICSKICIGSRRKKLKFVCSKCSPWDGVCVCVCVHSDSNHGKSLCKQ